LRTLLNHNNNCWFQSALEVIRRALEHNRIDYADENMPEPLSLLGVALTMLAKGDVLLDSSPCSGTEVLMWAIGGNNTGSFCRMSTMFEVLPIIAAEDKELLEACTYMNTQGKRVAATFPWRSGESIHGTMERIFTKTARTLPQMMFFDVCGVQTIVPTDVVFNLNPTHRLAYEAVGYIYSNREHFVPVVLAQGHLHVADGNTNSAILQKCPTLKSVSDDRHQFRSFTVAVACDGTPIPGDDLDGYRLACVVYAYRPPLARPSDPNFMHVDEMTHVQLGCRSGANERAYTRSPVLRLR
jgi:hypothetical protein